MRWLVVVALCGVLGCGTGLRRVRVPPRCPDGLPPKILTHIACPPDSICGYSCMPGRWDDPAKKSAPGKPHRLGAALVRESVAVDIGDAFRGFGADDRSLVARMAEAVPAARRVIWALVPTCHVVPKGPRTGGGLPFALRQFPKLVDGRVVLHDATGLGRPEQKPLSGPPLDRRASEFEGQ